MAINSSPSSFALTPRANAFALGKDPGLMLYTLSKLTKVYEDRTVLDIPFLEIERGDSCALLGPNGAGKTTLLHILGFLVPPTTGRIVFDSRPVQLTESYLQHLRKSVILVDQQPILFTTSVYKNIEFGLKIRQIPGDVRKPMIEEALDLVGMGSFAQAPAGKLSGGETQRVALARAIAAMPDVLLCDEPTASVDVENQATIINILKQINEEKKMTVLFTTHDRFQAGSLAHNILYLDHGRLTRGPSENIFPAVWTRKGDHRGVCDIQGAIRLSIPLEMSQRKQERIRLMIHPEKLFLGDPKESHGREDSGNHPVKGRVVQITEEKEKIRVVVDAGVWITLLVSNDTYMKNPTLVGEQVTISIPSKAVEILSVG